MMNLRLFLWLAFVPILAVPESAVGQSTPDHLEARGPGVRAAFAADAARSLKPIDPAATGVFLPYSNSLKVPHTVYAERITALKIEIPTPGWGTLIGAVGGGAYAGIAIYGMSGDASETGRAMLAAAAIGAAAGYVVDFMIANL